MFFITATKSGGAILGPISTFLGWIMDGIFRVTNLVGIMNIGLSIILFTIVIKLLLAPMTIKQQKFSRLNSYMMPEIQVVQDKYKNKRDNESLMKQNMEMQEIYKKYGVKPTAGCLSLIIQMPILFALYRVVYNIPAYVSSVKNVYMEVVNKIISVVGDGWASNSVLKSLAEGTRNLNLGGNDFANTDQLIDMLYSFDASKWSSLQEQIQGLNIADQVDKIHDMNSFLGISLFNSPSSYVTNHDNIWQVIVAIAIPLLAGLSQWISVKISTIQNENRKTKLGQSSEPSSMEKSMKMMSNIMPIISIVFCFTLSACIGIYWTISSAASLVIQLCVNAYMDKLDVNDIIKANMEKINAKRAKRGLPPQKISTVAAQTVKNTTMSEEEKEKIREKRQDAIKDSTEYYKSSSSYKPGSLAAKANMVKQFEEKNAKKSGRK